MVKIKNTFIRDLLVVELDIYKDERGFFSEIYNSLNFNKVGIKDNFIQDNYSISKPGVLRGLHFQRNPGQVKLVGCVSGKIWDVAVDIRQGSKTFGKYFSIELSADNGKLLYIPEGFAHGFCVIGNSDAHLLYKVNNFYSKEGDSGIIYNDPEIGIDWPVNNPILSYKDKNLPSLSQVINY